MNKFFFENELREFLIILLIFYLINFFLSANSYYHIEGMMSYVNSNMNPLNKNFFEIIFNGYYFDANPSRFRPLSHSIEYVDNILRNNIFYLFPTNPFLNTFSNHIVNLTSIFFLNRIFTELKFEILTKIVLILLIILSTYYLSTQYFLIRPSKKIIIMISIIAIYNLILYHKNTDKKHLYFGLIFNLLLCIVDEEGIFLSFLLTYIYFTRSIFFERKINNQEKEFYLLSCILFLAILSKILIFSDSYFNNIYEHSSVIERLPQFFDFKKFFLIFFFNLKYFYSGMFLSGVYSITIFIIILFAILLIYKIKIFLFILSILFSYILFMSSLEMIGGNVLMRSIGYYYGSSKLILLILFICFIFSKIEGLRKRIKLSNWNYIVSLILIIFIVINLNFFLKINTLILNIHFEGIQIKDFNDKLKFASKTKSCKVEQYDINNASYKKENKEILDQINMSDEYFINLIDGYGIITPKKQINKFFKYISKCY